ncbi:MAG: cell division protein FtsZ [Bacteroidetes bacterium]|nr:cell division protein FtsZ [Bacteroidota bacterium]
MKFDLPKEQASIIKVIGVGGGGSNAVTHMFKQGIKGVDFYICNTDVQSLSLSPVPNKISLGATGLGAGSIPSVGRDAALQREADIRSILEHNTSMLFITAGMGGGTGTGAAPVIAKIARELGILTVGIVTKPFNFEGRKRLQQADAGIEELKKSVDTILVICNDKLLDLQGDLKLSQAFGKADDVLTIAAKGIAEIITVTGRINVDFEDVKTVMSKSGKAIMGAGIASGPNRAIEAVQHALASPLLDDTDIKGADHVLLYITSGKNEISLEELNEITAYITTQAGENANVFWGDGIDDNLEDEIAITLIATGFDKRNKIIHQMDESFHNTYQTPISEIMPEPIKEVMLVEKPAIQVPERIEEPTFIFPEAAPEQPSAFTEDTPRVLHFEEPTTEKQITTPEPLEVRPSIRTNPDFEIVNRPIPEPAHERTFTSRPVIFPNQQDLESQRMERKSKLKDLSIKVKPTGSIEELEKQPAYMRRNVELSELNSSSESTISRYTLGTEENAKPGLRENNPYLHDNVD